MKIFILYKEGFNRRIKDNRKAKQLEKIRRSKMKSGGDCQGQN
jgi:hypothetical protein